MSLTFRAKTKSLVCADAFTDWKKVGGFSFNAFHEQKEEKNYSGFIFYEKIKQFLTPDCWLLENMTEKQQKIPRKTMKVLKNISKNSHTKKLASFKTMSSLLEKI